MIGTDLNLSLPALADTYSTAISKIRTALQSIEDSIAEKATTAGLDITSNLSIAGNHLTNVGGIVLAAGNSPATAGSIYYSGGNFYLKDATGVIQLTAAGAINLSAIGAIGGDYGSGDESLNYDLASQEYRLRASATAFADAVMDDLVLMEPGASPAQGVRVTAQAMASDYTLTLPAAVPSATSVVMMSNAGTLTAESSVTLPANGTFTVSGTGDYKHGEKTLNIPFGTVAFATTGTLTFGTFGTGAYAWTLTGSGVAVAYLPQVRVGWRIKSVTVVFNSANTPTLDLEIQNYDGVETTTVSTTGVAPELTVSFTSPAGGYTIDEDRIVFLKFTAGAGACDITNLRVVYDIP